MKRINLWPILIFFISASTVAQEPQPPPKPVAAKSLGEVRDGKFVSDRLGIKLTIPADYTIVSGVEAELLSAAGADLMKQGSSSDKQLDEAIGRTIQLLVIAEKPIGSTQNAALEIAAAKQEAGVTASMSLLANVNVLKGTPFSLKRSFGRVRIGANSFNAAELEGTLAGVVLRQRMYVIMHRGYSIVIAVFYVDEQQISDMDKVIATLVLTK